MWNIYSSINGMAIDLYSYQTMIYITAYRKIQLSIPSQNSKIIFEIASISCAVQLAVVHN